jgi:hypothetical protein
LPVADRTSGLPLASASSLSDAEADPQGRRFHEAFAGVFDAASEGVMDAVDDPYDFDERLGVQAIRSAAWDAPIFSRVPTEQRVASCSLTSRG